ncbi:hypothetical protein RB653_006528 [Dictyostelium firmibasis]|uniref:Tetratricopeptide repeat protein 7 N-terminal domain-containing protein n=1 Tax=Dictyostelium firmibasis TaxID=79012 RepID=A0AAN7UER6_9MYCE
MSTLKNKKLIQIEGEIEKARQDKNWNALTDLVRKYHKLNTDNTIPLELLINSEKYLSEFDYNNALTTLNKAYSVAPNNSEVLAYLGIVEYERNDIVKALSYLTRLNNPYGTGDNNNNNNSSSGNSSSVNSNNDNSGSNDMILNNRRVGLLIQAFTIKGKCYENQGNQQDAIKSYQNVIQITFKYFKNFKSIDKQTKLYIEDSLIRFAIIQKQFGIQISIKHLRSCLSSQIGLSKDTFRVSLTILAHLLLRNVCSASYIPTTLDSSNDNPNITNSNKHHQQQQQQQQLFYVPNDETEESILALLYAETVLSAQQQQLQQQQQQQHHQQYLLPPNNTSNTSAAAASSSASSLASSPQTFINANNNTVAPNSSSSSTTGTNVNPELTTHLNHHLNGHSHNSFEEQDPTLIYEDICLAYCRKEQYYPVVENYEKSLALNFSDQHKWIQLALALYSSGKYKRSLFIIEECLSKTPKNITLLLLASKICINHLNQITKAVLFAKQAVSIIDADDTASFNKAYLLMGIAYGKKAIECKSSHEKNQNLELALVSLKKSYEIDPYDYRNSYHLALVYADSRDTPMALKYIHESLALNPYEPSLWSCLALLLSSNKNYELAYRTCNHALSQSPTNVELLLIKAKLELALDDGSQALITYKTIFSHLVSKTLTSNEDIDDSVSLSRNRKSGPSSVVSFDLRSGTTAGDSRSHRSYSINNAEMDSAMRDFEDSPTSPKDLLRTTTSSGGSGGGGNSGSGNSGSSGSHCLSSKEVHRNIALWLSLAEAFTQQRMFKDAAQCLAQAESIDNDSADVYYHQGYLLETQDLMAKAIANYQKALTIDSTHTNSSIRLALYYFRENDLLLAENNLTTILRSSDPTSHQAWFQLGLVLKAKGEIERSSDCFKKAIELDSTSPLIPYSQISRFVF